MNIRTETPADYSSVREINDLSFGGPAEGQLVAGLRQLPGTISLVAEEHNQLIGHIMFSLGSVLDEISGEHAEVTILAPMAVLPSHQRQGVGSMLVRGGLQACREAGHQLIVVLGHPWYYPLFGFTPASRVGIRYPQPVRDEVFMALELTPGAADLAQGVLQLPEPFALVS